MFSPRLHLAKVLLGTTPRIRLPRNMSVADEFKGLSAPGQVRGQILLVGEQLAGTSELLRIFLKKSPLGLNQLRPKLLSPVGLLLV